MVNYNDKRSRVDLWNAVYSGKHERKLYHDPRTGELAANYLQHPQIHNIEDWGCGHGGFKKYIGEDQQYIGIDGSKSNYADKIVDLENYRSNVDAIHMRHVLEHNPNWELVLQNALVSFKKRMVLTLFTPLVEETLILNEYPNFLNTGVTMIDIAFKKEDITKHFNGIKWNALFNLNTETQYDIEHIFYLEHI